MLQSLTIMSNLWRLTLVVFSLFIVYVSSCRFDEQDPDDSSMLNIVCVGMNIFPSFDHLTVLQKENISAIRVSDGTFDTIPVGAISDFPMLKKLDFSHNQMTGFSNNSVQYAPLLTTINLSYNSLRCDETLIPWLRKWRLIDWDNRSVSGDCTNTASNIQQLVERDPSTINTVQFADEFVTIPVDTTSLMLEFTRSGNLDLATDFRVNTQYFNVTSETISVPSNANTGQCDIVVPSPPVMGNHTVELIPQYVIYPVASVVINLPDTLEPSIVFEPNANEPVSNIVVKSGSTSGSYIISGINEASEPIVLGDIITTDNSGFVHLVSIELSYKYKVHKSPIQVSVGENVTLEDSVGFELKFTFTDRSNNQKFLIVNGDTVDITKPIIDKCMKEFGDDAIKFVITQIPAGYRVELQDEDESPLKQSFEVTDNSGVVSFSWIVSYPNDKIVKSSSQEDLEESLVDADEVKFTFKDTRGKEPAECSLKRNSAPIGLIIFLILFGLIIIIAIVAGSYYYYKSKNSEPAKCSSSKAAVDVEPKEV